jgi:hypothetical protein
MATMTHRLQLLLDDERYDRVAEAARRQRTSVASVIRDAIDQMTADDEQARQAALQRILDAEPTPVPDDPADVKREIYEMHDERARRWGA